MTFHQECFLGALAGSRCGPGWTAAAVSSVPFIIQLRTGLTAWRATVVLTRAPRSGAARHVRPTIHESSANARAAESLRHLHAVAGALQAVQDHAGEMRTRWFRRPGPVWLGALLLGPAVAAGLVPWRGTLRSDHVVLGLVLVVACVAAAGRPPAGLLAAVTTGLAYDVFWTQPYGSLRVLRASDVVTVLLLVAVGAAVEQLSWWGGRQRAAAAERSGYLTSLRAAATPTATNPVVAVRAAEDALATLLQAERCRLVLDGPRPATLLQPDGSVTRSGRPLRVDADGLPTDDVIGVPAPIEDQPQAWFAVTAAGEVARPTREQRQVAALLATLAARSLAVQAS